MWAAEIKFSIEYTDHYIEILQKIIGNITRNHTDVLLIIRQKYYAYCTLNVISDERRAISNKSFAFSHVTTQSKALIGYRSSLIAYRVQCAVDIIAMFFCIIDKMYCCLNITASGLVYIVYLICVLGTISVSN